MRLLVSVIILLAFAAAPVTAQVVLNAAPTVRVVSGDAATERTVLSEGEQEEFRVVITTRNGRYFWASREGAELVHSTSGAFHWFWDPGGGGSVKILDQELLQPAALRDPELPRFLYMEHLTLWLDTITYWGSADTFNLDGRDQPRDP